MDPHILTQLEGRCKEISGWVTVSSCIFSYLVYNLVGAFLGLAIMLRGESLSARVDSQCAKKTSKCVGLVSDVSELS